MPVRRSSRRALGLVLGLGVVAAQAHAATGAIPGASDSGRMEESDVLTIPAQVIANPRTRVALVASEDGQIEAPAGGFLLPGQAVRTGQLLALLRPAYSQIERRDLGVDRAGAQRDEYINKLQLDRYKVDGSRPFDIKLPTLTVQLVADYRSAHAQVSEIAGALLNRIPISAPADGVLLHAFAQSGRVVVAGQPIFELNTSADLAVVANFVDDDLDAASPAAAETLDHRALLLSFLGSSDDPVLRSHRAVYVVQSAAQTEVGEPVQLTLRRRPKLALSGLDVPR